MLHRRRMPWECKYYMYILKHTNANFRVCLLSLVTRNIEFYQRENNITLRLINEECLNYIIKKCVLLWKKCQEIWCFQKILKLFFICIVQLYTISKQRQFYCDTNMNGGCTWHMGSVVSMVHDPFSFAVFLEGLSTNYNKIIDIQENNSYCTISEPLAMVHTCTFVRVWRQPWYCIWFLCRLRVSPLIGLASLEYFHCISGIGSSFFVPLTTFVSKVWCHAQINTVSLILKAIFVFRHLMSISNNILTNKIALTTSNIILPFPANASRYSNISLSRAGTILAYNSWCPAMVGTAKKNRKTAYKRGGYSFQLRSDQTDFIKWKTFSWQSSPLEYCRSRCATCIDAKHLFLVCLKFELSFLAKVV